MTRAERAQEAARLRAEGLLLREIAKRMGISPSYAQELVADPDSVNVRDRKLGYCGLCVDCGEQIIAEIQARAVDGEPPVMLANIALTKSAEHYFGSWNAAVVAAGFEPRRRGQTRQRARAAA